jgi:betaine lipid synthase
MLSTIPTASLLIDMLPSGTYLKVITAAGLLAVLAVAIFAVALFGSKDDSKYLHILNSYLTFFYASVLKPHSDGSGDSQQDALESFYKIQATVYDTSRRRLLRGREDMLGLAAAQLKFRIEQEGRVGSRPIWVDVS